jgi:hypothetical protein
MTERIKAQMIECGFDPNDAAVSNWFAGLLEKDRAELVELSNDSKGYIPTATDLGVNLDRLTR